MNKRRHFENETELARNIIKWLEVQHWEVYQEVQPRSLGHTADIVATQKRLIWVIECKLSFGLSVIEQAFNWLGFAHFVSVAVPYTTNDKMARLVLERFGIGHLEAVNYGKEAGVEIYERGGPSFNRKARVARFLNVLTPERKTYAEAGNARGSKWTPFQQTCLHVRNAVEARPGITMKEMIDTITTHYRSPSTARACLTHWIESGKVVGVHCQRDGKYLRLFPEGQCMVSAEQAPLFMEAA